MSFVVRWRLSMTLLLAAMAVAAATSCGGRSAWARLQWSDDDASWAPTGRSLLFASNRDATPAQGDEGNGRYALYAMGVNGGTLRQLTRPGPCSDEDPVPSPSGSRIAFLRSCGGSTELWVIPNNGGQARSVASDVVSDAGWSPGGHLIAFTRSRDATDPSSPNDLYLVPANGGSARLVAKGGGATALGSSVGAFAWSHDGTRIAFGCQGGSVCATEVGTGAIRRLHLFSSGNDVSSVAWSPDDKELAFVDGSGGSYDPDYSAWVMAADGQHAHRLPRHGEGNVDAVEWLPKHPQVLIINTDYGKAYLIRADGTGKHDLPFDVDTVAPSMDGGKLLFVRRVFDRDGNYYRSAISLANIKTGTTRQLTQGR
jgi:Tol biopolymer transport system component